jgi:hypothetical protein
MALGRVATAVAVVGLAPVGVIQGATRRYKDRMHFRRGPLLRRNLGERGCLLSSVTDDRLFFCLAVRVCAGEKKAPTINSELWHACAGPLVSLPPAGSLVVYFPQGHSEQVSSHLPAQLFSAKCPLFFFVIYGNGSLTTLLVLIWSPLLGLLCSGDDNDYKFFMLLPGGMVSA